MENLNLKIASKLLKVAKELIADSDYNYIYDPEHRKHPGGGYVKTEKGWQKGKQNKKENQSQQLKNHLVKQLNIPEQDIQQMMEAEKYLKIECDDKPVNREVAKKILGDAYWHGLNRAAFHQTGTPSTDDGHEWHFDCRSYFRQEKKPRQTSWKKTVQNLAPEVKEKMLQDKKCPSKILDALADEHKLRLKIALHPNTSAETLDKMVDDPSNEVAQNIALHKNTSAKTLDKLSGHDDFAVRHNVARNKNTSTETLDELSEDKYQPTRFCVATNPNTSIETLKKLKSDKDEIVRSKASFYLKKKQQQQNAASATSSEPSKSSEQSKLPKYKFKGDDKTQAIIRKKFEKDQNSEETNTIYGEMAKFSRDDVAPMGVYHGRSKEQLKADFIKNMDSSNYTSPQSFKKAQERIRKLSAQDFSKMLASIFADEEQEI